MGFSDQAGGLYAGIEEKFFAAMDFLADKGVPVYSVIDPLEEKGLPAFPIAIAGMIAIALIFYGLAFAAPPQAVLKLSLLDEKGEALRQVRIEANDAKSGNPVGLGSTSFQDGQEVRVPLAVGSKLLLVASKEGYDDASGEVFLRDALTSAEMRLEKVSKIGEATIRLVDDETGDPVESARIVAQFAGKANIECLEGSNGAYVCPGVAEGKQTGITVTQPNYEQRSFGTALGFSADNEVRLVPKASSRSGKSNIIVRAFDANTKQRLGNFSLRIYDALDNELVSSLTDSDGDGEQAEKVSKGISVRLVVERKDYLTYDSAGTQESATIRDDEIIREVYLLPGTNALTVSVLDATARPLPSVPVMLFGSAGEPIAQKTSSIAGEVIFEGLSSEQDYYASAWDEQYVPVRQKARLSQNNRLVFTMQHGTANNSGSLIVYTNDGKGAAVAGATLNFFEGDDTNGLLPLGLGAQKTDITGKFTFLAPLNSKIHVKATKGNLGGQAGVEVSETFKNEVIVTLSEPFSRVLLTVLGSDGREAEGGIVSVAAGDTSLFEGQYSAGGIAFNPKGNKYVSVIYTDGEGGGFEQEVGVEDQNAITVSKGGQKGVGTTPVAEFLGVYTISGEKADGLAKGEDMFLRFRATFPQGGSGNGLHVRLGEDSVGFVDSQDAGITGFSAIGAANFYGRSYSPMPRPGFEALDMENSGSEGQYNKWIELYFQSGGEKVINIRAKAKESAASQQAELHYRAWSSIGGKVYRVPSDDEIGLEKYSSAKTGLYAQTSLENIRILDSGSKCSNRLCASYRFVRSDGSEYAPQNFKAVLGEIYALQVDIAPSEALKATVKGSTVRQKPKIGFQGFGINDFAQMPDANSTDTSVQVENVSAPAGGTTGVRLYFKALEAENTSITLQLVTDKDSVTEQFHFSIYREKPILLTTVPSQVTYGDDFVIVLEDEQRVPIEDAQIRLEGRAGAKQTIRGDGSAKRGSAGRYFVKNFYGSGVVTYNVTAQGFRALDGQIEITKQGVLEWKEPEGYISIQKSQKSAEKEFELVNKSRQNVESLTFELKPVGQLPDGMSVRVSPMSDIAANSTQRIGISAQYNGEKDNAHGEVRVIAKGRTEAGLLVTAEHKIIVDYNPAIAQDCLEFSKPGIVVFIASGMDNRGNYDQQYYSNSQGYPAGTGFYDPNAGTLDSYYPNRANTTGFGGSSANAYSGFYNSYGQLGSGYYKYGGYSTSTSESFTASLAKRPECQVPLELKPEVVGEGKRTEGLEVDSKEIRLSPQGSQERRTDSDEVIVNVTNNLLRNYPGKESFHFDIIYRGGNFAKSLPVEVYVWNPSFALQVSRNIELYLGPANFMTPMPSGIEGIGQPVLSDIGYKAQVPLFVRNVGEADIENVHFRVSSKTSRGNVDVRVVPDFPIQVLRKGQAIDPPLTLFAQATRDAKTTLADVKQLDITGVINGASFSFGPVNLISHISGAQCLVAVPGNLAFISSKSTEGAISQELTLRNTCAEEVRVLDISRPPLGSNALQLVPTNVYIMPGAEAKFSLVLQKRENYNGSPMPIYVHAFLPRSGTPIDSTPVIVEVRLGKDVLKSTAAGEEMELNVCEGGTKKVRFPVMASGPAVCDSAYCDASQLSAFLADRLEDKVAEATKQVHNMGSEVFNARGCTQADMARGFCSFDGLGVKQESYSVYFSHDNLSPALLQKAISGKNSGIKNFTVSFFSGKSGGEYLGGYGKQVWLNSNIRGCGRYKVKFNGSVALQGGRFVPELMNVVIDIMPENEGEVSARQVTEQCAPLIQNINNFLPRDEGFTRSLKYDSWMGVVDPKDSALEQLSGEVAKTLFGTESRAVQGSISTNTLSIDLGSTEGYIVRLEMDKVPSDNPVTIRALIRDSVGAEKQLQREIVKDAASSIRNLRDNVVEGCIGADESYMLLKSSSALGKPQLLPIKEKIPVQFEVEQCAPLEFSSNIKETLSLSAKKSTEFEGIYVPPHFRPQRPKDGPDTQETITTIKVDNLDEKTNKFTAQARICAIGNSQFWNAQGKKIIVEAKSIEATQKSAKIPAQEAELAVCGIHPLKFVDEKAPKLDATKPGEYYYATFMWKGDPEELALSDLTKISEVEHRASVGDGILKGTGKLQLEEKPEVIAAKSKAANYYLTACALTSVVTSIVRPTVGIAGLFINPIADCVIPYAALMGEVNQNVKKVIDFFDTTIIKPVKDFFTGAGTMLGTVVKSILRFAGVGSALDRAQAQVRAQEDQALTTISIAYAETALIKDSVRAGFMTFDDKIYNSPAFFSKVKIVSDSIAEELTTKVHVNLFASSADVEVLGFLDEYKKRISGQIASDLGEEIAKRSSGAGRALGRGYLSVEEAGKLIKETSIKNVETEMLKDPALLAKIHNARLHAPTGAVNREIADKVVEGIFGDAKVKDLKPGARNATVAWTAPIEPSDPLKLGAIQHARDELVERFINRLNTAGTTLNPSTSALAIELQTIELSPSRNFTPKTLPGATYTMGGAIVTGPPTILAWTADISDAETQDLMRQFEEKAKAYLKSQVTSGTPDAAVADVIKKKAQNLGTSKVAEFSKEQTEVKTGKFTLKNIGAFGTTMLKEGALGLLANYVGMKAYDWILASELDKVTGVPQLGKRELPFASQSGFGVRLSQGDQFTKTILKYRTYRISVSQIIGTGGKELKMSRVGQIPQGIDPVKYVLNDCRNPGYDQEVGAVLPGLIPETEVVSKFPKPLRTKTMQATHVAAATNYLQKQPDGQRHGSIIATAVNCGGVSPCTGKPFASSFNAATGLNLEALVASIGEVKSGMGSDKDFRGQFMFGCDAKNAAIAAAKADVFPNAVCAARKLESYRATQCASGQGDVKCYWNAYNADAANDSGGLIRVTEGDFKDIYDAWAGYAWRAT